MVYLGPLLVLIGAAVVSGNLLQKLHKSFPYLPSFQEYGLPKEEIIQKEYAQPISLQFFTPSLVPSAIYITSDGREECDHPNEQPVYEHLVIPEGPVLPPLKIPAPAIPTFFKVAKPITILDAPHLPHHSLQELSTGIIDEEPAPLVIPEAPVLPPLVLPEQLVAVEKHKPNFVPWINVDQENSEPLRYAVIPEGPFLPSLTSPELPRQVPVEVPIVHRPLVIPKAPVLPPIVLPELPTGVEHRIPNLVPCTDVDQENSELLKSVTIPEAPFLPSFTLPELPVQVIVEEPAHIGQTPLVIPKAPVLPPLVFPELPVGVEYQTPNSVPFIEVDYENSEPLKSVVIPEAPFLRSFTFPELPAQVILEESTHIAQRPLVTPKAPVLPPLILPELPSGVEYQTPNFVPCVQADQENFEPLTPVDIPETSFLPSFTVPELPVQVIVEEPAHIVSDVPEPELVVIPEAPMLPPLSLPELPPIITIDDHISVPTIPELPPYVNDLEHDSIPQAPELPPLVLPETPVGVAEDYIPPLYSPEVYGAIPIAERAPFDFANPTAPVLPPLILPELITGVEYETPHFVPCKDVDQEKLELIPPVVIPEAPFLPSFTLPELPVQVIVEEPAHIVSDVPQPEPVFIPEAPVLPPLSLPELPSIINIDDHIYVPTNPELPPYSIELEQDSIPQAPVLPPLVLPETPLVVAEDSSPPLYFPEVYEAVPIAERAPFDSAHLTAPVLPPLVLPELLAGVEYQTPNFVPCIEVDRENSVLLKPVVIPEAPFLPSFTPPELPVQVIVEEPAHIVSDVPQPEPVFIPEAPVLPPLSLPELPSIINIDDHIYVPTNPELPPYSIELEQDSIPQAPVLPPLVLPETPLVVAEDSSPPLYFPEVYEAVPIAERAPFDSAHLTAPVLPPLVLPELLAGVEYQTPNFVPCIEVDRENSVLLKPVVIPEAPFLPSFTPPELPVQAIVEEPAHIMSDVSQPEPVVIPEAPVLPPLSLPELPDIITIDDHISVPTNPELPPYINEVEHDLIPLAPELPPLVLPETPIVVAEDSIPPLYSPEVSIAIPIDQRAPFDSAHTIASSPIVIEAPVQIVIQGSKYGPAECDTIIKERILPYIFDARKKLPLSLARKVVVLGSGQ